MQEVHNGTVRTIKGFPNPIRTGAKSLFPDILHVNPLYAKIWMDFLGYPQPNPQELSNLNTSEKKISIRISPRTTTPAPSRTANFHVEICIPGARVRRVSPPFFITSARAGN